MKLPERVTILCHHGLGGRHASQAAADRLGCPGGRVVDTNLEAAVQSISRSRLEALPSLDMAERAVAAFLGLEEE